MTRTGAIFAALALVCSCSGEADECRPAAATCAKTADCCDALVCEKNVCAVPASGRSVLTWNITNNCLSGGVVKYRFFDRTIRTMSDIRSIGPGKSDVVTLGCQTGHQVCFGGRDESDGAYYGLDVDGSEKCTDCCFTCADKSITFGPLTC